MTTSSVSITDRARALRVASADRLSEPVLAAFDAEIAALQQAGLPRDIADVGAVLPDVDLLDVAGQPTTLYTATGSKPVVLVFYRGAWCPYCNLTLRAYQNELIPGLIERGVGLIAISPQKPDGSARMQQTQDLSYTVLSDPGNQLAAELGVLTAPSAAARAAQASLGLDLTDVNADATAALPMPTVVILDAAAAIGWIDVHPDYRTRTEPAQVLGALDAMRDRLGGATRDGAAS